MAQEKIFRLQSAQQDKYTSHTEMTKRQVVAHALSDAIKAIELHKSETIIIVLTNISFQSCPKKYELN